MLKKNPLFTVTIAVLLIAFLGLAYLAYASYAKTGKLKKKLGQAESQLRSQASLQIAPSEENVAASVENVAALEHKLSVIRGDLKHGSRLTSTDDGVRVLASVQQYISEFQRAVKNHTNEAGEPTPIIVPEDFGFGFDEYLNEAQPPATPQEVIYLDKQRQVLGYFVRKLINASPAEIVSVERESFDVTRGAAQPIAKTNDIKGFRVLEAVTAAQKGAIDTLGFRVSFVGGTSCLRDFLNDLNKFDLPIVVRSIEVERSEASEKASAPAEKNSMDDIFSAFGGDATQEEKQAAADQLNTPVIKGNTSKYTLILEYFEVVMQSSAQEEVNS
ncbi:Amuc_1100 family pilus-like protein [Coraliomargarita akajimensis]|uniref:Uncharacterized protein n=1 Tax=Coraliomargarita akajimensis (strain DSM 45221 / IAM 15411 / JCM 23193 / KCTC 12865 / 04OKA010-24) TaxID=583355 RepID=D5EKQ1_CORAD|nr:Amuc_1100 family pilus-like protein [Coraliomargarita akajimensis]ADE54958.1 hypothetical protein Caka_1940 [Coraliomargarita akajimensis DSM 45221]